MGEAVRGEFAASLCRANNEPAPTTIRVNTLPTTRERLAGDLAEPGIGAAATALSPHGLSIKGFDRLADLDLFTRGHFTVQDGSSMLVRTCLGAAKRRFHR